MGDRTNSREAGSLVLVGFTLGQNHGQPLRGWADHNVSLVAAVASMAEGADFEKTHP